ncbi:sigma-70 family RNA polymerase sigma factor [Bacillus aquiflavi]|uniref:RNA polymerase sigma factor n=1 Tax=Bacillus aquiflavi TaxID=2672567 RepID=A0A6B3W5F8_9BACI|nr:sigma-70 family RNA polymerase sigma factor [Bacillus aquiflavi]MBA4538609.1 sigma-70 family RNA polymerase sigma factor [Bacillus aquiflavi]NEY82971.1 sigma-70 family RNA polymerase sigma factor [Bacillus aquiflavi]UAC49157.1 sigma-70 family RNA polymerase sigma factor [Bacillus aquiflavi]
MNYEEVFRGIYEEYSDKVYSYIFLLVKQKEIAEDLTQETFIRVYKHLNKFNGEAKMLTWIVKISRNVTIDYFRKNAKFKFSPIEKYQFISDDPTPTEIVMKGEKIVFLYKSIQQLKLSYQEVLILRKIKGFSIKETSEILGWNENKVKVTTSRAIQALKREMKKRSAFHEEIFRNG